MSNLKEQLDVDIKRFFEQIETQNFNDQKETLRNLFNKYIHLSKADHVMDYYDLNDIVSNAKGKFSRKTFPVFLGKKRRKVMDTEQANLCIIESVISHLNQKDCLKKLPKFDYKEDKF